MLYLLQTYGEDFSLLKIGFSENLDRRLKSYYECNPLVKILSTREGDKKLESFMHRYFREFKYPELNEWFYYSDEIVKNFDSLEIPDDSSFDSLHSLPRFEERLKYFSLYAIDHPEDLNKIPKDYLLYIMKFKYKEMSSCGFRKDVLDKKLRLKLKKKGLESDQSFRNLLYESFEVGEVYTFKLIKETLKDLMDKSNVGLKAKANLLENYFNVKTVRVQNSETGKRDAGFKILSIKE